MDKSHIQSLAQELRRERSVTQSCQQDVMVLREQLSRAQGRIDSLEKVRLELSEQLAQNEKVREGQAGHINRLEEVCQ